MISEGKQIVLCFLHSFKLKSCQIVALEHSHEFTGCRQSQWPVFSWTASHTFWNTDWNSSNRWLNVTLWGFLSLSVHGLGGGAAVFSIGCVMRRFKECVGVVWACGLTVYLPLPFMSEGPVTLSCKPLQLDLYLWDSWGVLSVIDAPFYEGNFLLTVFPSCSTSYCLGNSSVLLLFVIFNPVCGI